MSIILYLANLFSVYLPGRPGRAGCDCGRGCGCDSEPPLRHSDLPWSYPFPFRAGSCWNHLSVLNRDVWSCFHISMLSNLRNVIWCIDIVICKNQISNNYFHKKWHSPDQSFPELAQKWSFISGKHFNFTLHCCCCCASEYIKMILTNPLDRNPWIPWQMDCWQFSAGLSRKWYSDEVFTLKTDKEESATPLNRADGMWVSLSF